MLTIIIIALFASLCFLEWFIDGFVEYVVGPAIDAIDDYSERHSK